MPTPSEQKALAFIAIVVLLGGAVRILRAGPPVANSVEQQALARQAAVVDTAAARAREHKQGKRVKHPAKGDTLPHVVAGVASVPPTFARPDQPFAHAPGFPPPSPRIEVDSRGPHFADGPTTAVKNSTRSASAGGVVDMDAASESEIEHLPRIGPAMARRVLANRDSLGPFKSLEGLRRVKGMGKATIDRLAPLISFGGRPAAPSP